MSTISSVNNTTSTVSGNRQEVASASSTADKKKTEEESASADAAAGGGTTIELSTRAQKIQKLNEEFFPAGPRSVKITPAFIERLQEYGFLSAEEADRFNPARQAAGDQPTNTLGELSVFIDDFTDKLKREFPESSLIAVLQKAQSAINNLDGSNPPDTATDIKAVIAELGQYASSDEVQSLSEDDKWSLQQLEIALRVADKLGQQDNRSEQVNRYLSILNQSL